MPPLHLYMQNFDPCFSFFFSCLQPLHAEYTHAPRCSLGKCHLSSKCDELLAASSYLSCFNCAVMNMTTTSVSSCRCWQKPLLSLSPSIHFLFFPLIDYLYICPSVYLKRLSVLQVEPPSTSSPTCSPCLPPFVSAPSFLLCSFSGPVFPVGHINWLICDNPAVRIISLL